MKVSTTDWVGAPGPVVEDVLPEQRRLLLTDLLLDARGQEDLYLREIEKAEAGETILNLYNNYVDAQLYPDGHVIIEELRYTPEDEAERGPPARTEITLAEAKQLILDWLAAKKRWYGEHRRDAVTSESGNEAQQAKKDP